VLLTPEQQLLAFCEKCAPGKMGVIPPLLAPARRMSWSKCSRRSTARKLSTRTSKIRHPTMEGINGDGTASGEKK
jgi:hypothetical protein